MTTVTVMERIMMRAFKPHSSLWFSLAMGNNYPSFSHWFY